MTRCDKVPACAFFTGPNLNISTRLRDFLVATYCEGELQLRCKRRKWQEDKGDDPPGQMLPNGYFCDLTKDPA